jgi:hypothetical protein
MNLLIMQFSSATCRVLKSCLVIDLQKYKTAKHFMKSELLDFGLCPSSGIIENRKHDVSENRSVSILR